MFISKQQIDERLKHAGLVLGRWRDDPVSYAIEACGIVPTDKQAMILYSVARNRRVAVRSGHGIGKSRVLGLLVNWFLDTMWSPDGPAVKVPCTGPSGGNISDVLWSEVGIVYNNKAAWLKDQFVLLSDRMVYESNPGLMFAVLRTARKDNPDSLQGFHGKTLFIMDEASGIPDAVFELARGAMSDEHSYAIMTGNPTHSTGYFAKAFTGTASSWAQMRVASLDTMTDREYSYKRMDSLGNIVVERVRGRVTPAYISDMSAEFGKSSNTFRVRVLGEFGTGSNDRVIESAYIDGAFGRSEPEHQAPGTQRIAGVDVAYTGEDDSAVVVRNGTVVEYVDCWHGADTVETTSRLCALAAEFRAANKPIDRFCIDTIGIGAGVYDQLRVRGMPCVPVHASAVPLEDGGPACRKMRDWLWWRGRMFFRNMKCVMVGPQDAEVWKRLAYELALPGYTYKDGKIVVEGKAEMKSRGEKSPNLADALLLSLYFNWDTKSSAARSAKSHTYQRRKLNWKRKWKLV